MVFVFLVGGLVLGLAVSFGEDNDGCVLLLKKRERKVVSSVERKCGLWRRS